jgi:Uncharacterised nucleotidyltransferase
MRRAVDEHAHGEQLLQTARALALDALAAVVVKRLAEQGTECLLLRGPAIAEVLYKDSEQRSYDDVDLLIHPNGLGAAETALANLGLRQSPLEAALPASRPHHAHTWVTTDGRAVDLHTTLVGVDGAPRNVWAVLRERARARRLEGVDVLVPSDAGLALVVALHAAHHVDRSPRPMDDLERALDLLTANVWSEAGELARRTDAVEAFAAGLGLSSRGQVVLTRLGLEIKGPARRRSGEMSFHVAQGLAWLQRIPGTRAKVAFLRERLLPSPRAMKRRSGLAARGATGLGLAYVVRWLAAVRYLPHALAALRRSRR